MTNLRCLPALALLSTMACATPNRSGEVRGALPHGVSIGTSGFATLLNAPPVPYPDVPPPPDDRRTADAEEVERMMNPDEATTEAAVALDARLRAGVPANYVGMQVVRDPRPRFAFQFRREAAATLARFSRDPRFVAREGGVPEAELQPIFDTWWPRFQAHRLVGAGAVAALDGVVRIDMNVDKATFDTIAAVQGWTLPDRLELNFAPPPNPRSIDPALKSLVRLFPREDRRPAVVLSAALSGRLILRDGCFRLSEWGEGGEPLVIFGRDSELGIDGEGYMVVRNGDGSAYNRGDAPRIGERIVWSGPRGTDESDTGVQALRAACGSGPIVAVGEPSSMAARRARAWEVDEYARTHRVSRQAAWDVLTTCWSRHVADPGAEGLAACVPPPPPPRPAPRQ